MPLLQLLQMRRLRASRGGQLAEELQGALGGVLARVVDVLPVVPEARVHRLRADGYRAGPGRAAACGGRGVSRGGWLRWWMRGDWGLGMMRGDWKEWKVRAG